LYSFIYHDYTFYLVHGHHAFRYFWWDFFYILNRQVKLGQSKITKWKKINDWIWITVSKFKFVVSVSLVKIKCLFESICALVRKKILLQCLLGKNRIFTTLLSFISKMIFIRLHSVADLFLAKCARAYAWWYRFRRLIKGVCIVKLINTLLQFDVHYTYYITYRNLRHIQINTSFQNCIQKSISLQYLITFNYIIKNSYRIPSLKLNKISSFFSKFYGTFVNFQH
jgi:hypothetical protein